MMPEKKPDKPELHVHDPSKLKGRLKPIGGSRSDDWNNILANQTISALWYWKGADGEQTRRQQRATVDAMIGIAPRDELEGMIAAQLIACHNASMECYRRAMIPEQPLEAWKEQLSQANKLSRTYATLLETLNKHRGKGAQKVTVEHVHVHAGGQAIVGSVESPGGGVSPKAKDQPHAIAHTPVTPMPSPDTTRNRVPVACDAERPMQDARWDLTGGAQGQ
jgi:hypothetical protein